MPIQIDELIIRAEISDMARGKKTDRQFSSSDYASQHTAHEKERYCLDKYLNDRRER